MDISIFKKLGLSDKEIKIYLALIKNGPCSVRKLAELSGLNRGTSYDILKSLQEINLVSYYHHETKQKFVAEDGEFLLKLINDQEEELKKTKEKIKKILPEIKSWQNKEGDRPTTKYYEGNKGVKLILDDILFSLNNFLEKDREYYVYSATKASQAINKAYPDFTGKRIKNKIKVKVISLAQGGGLSGLDERRWLGTSDESATFIIIYAGKCAFIANDEQSNPVGVIIENKAIYQTQKILFLSLWEFLKK